MRSKLLIPIFLMICLQTTEAQIWQQNDNIFNPSGVPSLAFSQPRFADLDSDGDWDMILGNINGPPRYYENSGTSSNPHFSAGDDLFTNVQDLDCEVGVCVDLDQDGDLDFVTGGYTGLQLYDNVGDASAADFVRIDGFFGDLGLGSNPVPHFADLDGDADLDMVVGISEGGQVKYFENFGTADAAIFLDGEFQTWFDVGLYAYPWFADLDADGDMDLLVGRDGYNFYYYRNDGSSESWSWVENNAQFVGLGTSTYWNSPCLVDLTGDGKLDLVHGTASGPLKYYRNTGTLTNASWTEVTSLFGGVLDVGGASNPYFIDFDGDGDQDMLSGSQMGDIKYYENTGTPQAPAWTANHGLFSSIDHSIYSAVAAGDLDADGLIDLVVGDLNGGLFYHHNTGTGFPYVASMFTGVTVGGWSSPFLMDMDRDHDLDLIVGREDGGISYFENTGTIELAAWTENPSMFAGIDVGNSAVVTLGEVNRDGILDMITGNLSHELQFFSYENGSWVEYPELVAGLEVGQNAAPGLADLNGDGDLDLAVGNYDGTFNYFENLSIVPTQATPLVPDRACLYPPYPNPFNPSTTLRFDLQEADVATLRIYDLSGGLVQTLAEGSLEAGSHTVSWNALTGQGSQVAAGIYLVVLETPKNRLTQKLVLIR